MEIKKWQGQAEEAACTSAQITENVCTVEQMEKAVEIVKARWLKKEISQVELRKRLNAAVDTFRQEPDFPKFKNYIEDKLLLDKNVKASTTVIAGTLLSLTPILLSVNVSVLTLLETSQLLRAIMLLCSLTISAGLAVMAFSIIGKHIGCYAREKSFYEILLQIL